MHMSDTAMSHLRGSQNYVWSVSDVLGHGATGSVYKCRHKKTGELFAVKTFNNASHSRPVDIQMREFDVLQKLSHENIVQLHAVEEEAHSRVLIMDLCTGGSLFNILDNPENAYGLDEAEFLCVLRDVAAGMKHLRDNDVVHRDIKPGNIMRYITDDGRSIYKLIDFGAARQLQDEEQFASLYGTEEYLYPDMYERAVLRRLTGKQFMATVDLWSIGVTLYHIATGHLPFRPFGGARRNKELMYEITTRKPAGVISGVQHSDGGPIDYSYQLPQSCRLSRGLKRLVEPLLAGLLANEADQALSFEAFFTTVQQIVHNKIIYVFHAASCSLLNVYLPDESSLAELRGAITSQTDVSSSDQFILFENHELRDVVDEGELASLFPCTSPSNPLYLFSVSDDTAAPSSLDSILSATVPTLPAGVKESSDVQLDSDALFVKNCCAIVHCHQRLISDLLRDQQLLNKAAKMYRLVLEREVTQVRDDFEGFRALVNEIGNRISLLSCSYSMHLALITELSSLKNVAVSDMPTSIMDAFTRRNICYNKLKQEVDSINSTDINELLQLPSQCSASSLDNCRCPPTNNCAKKAELLVKALRQTLSDFSRDRSLVRLSYNEGQIHKFERNKAKQNTIKSTSLVQQHCLPNMQQMFDKFTAWYKQMQKVQMQLTQLKNKIDSIVPQQEVLTESLEEMQAECTAKLWSSVERLGVTVKPASAFNAASSLPSPHVVTANGDFVFHTRQRKKLREITQCLEMNNQQMAALKNVVQENDKYLKCLSSGPSQLPRPSAHTGAAGPYLQLDDVDETLHSEPDNAQL